MLASIVSIMATSAAPTGPLEVSTTLGVVEGFIAAGVRVWLGLRYGKAPIGDLRWRNPVYPDIVMDSVYEAYATPPSCPQACSFSESKLLL